MSASLAHIAGVGVSEAKGARVDELTGIQAGVKALLDAGVTYGDVDHSVACFLDDQLQIPSSCFDTLGMKGAAVSVVNNDSGIFTAVQYIKSGQANCVLVLGIDTEASANSNKVAVVGIVLVSNLILKSHAYLRDSAICISACCLTNHVYSRRSGGSNGARASKTVVDTALRQANMVAKYMSIVEIRGSTAKESGQSLGGIQDTQAKPPTSLGFNGVAGWLSLCGMVWQLRGWAHDRPVPQAMNCLLYTSNADGAASVSILCRSDGGSAPAWKAVKDVREGRERLGYNPAIDVRDISREDLENVRTADEFTSDAAVKRLELRVKGGDRAALARL